MSKNGLANMPESYSQTAPMILKRLGELGLKLEEVLNMDKETLQDTLVGMKPTNVRQASTMMSFLSAYGRACEKLEFVDLVSSIDRKEIIQTNSKKKFISEEEFKDLLYNIEMTEELNTYYGIAILDCIFQGIYSPKLTALKNLRVSDINGNEVTVKPDEGDGKPYKVKVTSDLVELLKDLAQKDTCQRRNPHGTFEIPVEGIFSDSCFKIETRDNGKEPDYYATYYKRVNLLTGKYLDYKVKPNNLYLSGLMAKIIRRMRANGFSDDKIRESFRFNHKAGYDIDIIQTTVMKSGFTKEMYLFRDSVKNNVDDFL